MSEPTPSETRPPWSGHDPVGALAELPPEYIPAQRAPRTSPNVLLHEFAHVALRARQERQA